MSSRRAKPQPLSDTEIRQIAAGIAEGRPPMVWFTADAVGVPEGRSGKVIALGDPAEGDFLQVRPTGSKDVLPFSPTEVTLTKPPKQAPANKPTAKKTTPTGTAATKTSAPAPSASKTPATRKDTAVSMPSTVSPSPTPPSPAPVQPAAGEAESKSAESRTAEQKPSGQKPAAKQPQGSRPAREKAATARKSKTPEVTVTLSGTADGEWTVDVVHGKKRTTRGLSVPGATVAQAAKILHPEVAEVVDAVLESVRNTQRVKVEQLQAELEQARRVLDELSG